MSSHNHPVIGTDTLVTVHRYVVSTREKSELGPKTIQRAVLDGDLTSSSGTVRVTLTVAEGPHAGANAYRSEKGLWFAQYNPTLENPDRTPYV